MRWNGASRFEFIGKSMEIKTTIWSEFPNGGKAIGEQILVSEESDKSKRAGLWESQKHWIQKHCFLKINFKRTAFVPVFGYPKGDFGPLT